MNGTYQVTVGDRGRLVLLAEVRERAGLAEGPPLVLPESPEGLVLLTRDQAKARVRGQFAGGSLIEALLATRRSEADRDDAATPDHP